MPSNVYANGNSIACKASMDKVIIPPSDVCMSPPSPPAGPIPIPYPNVSFSKDTKSGSKKVKIGNKPVMLKNKSYYKSSPLGNEAATRSFGAGVVSHQITGKTFFAAWSMDVKFEGKNVDRHLDITQSNSSNPGNSVGPDANKMTTDSDKEEEKCKCCGKAMHSEAQRNGDSLNEDEFYGTADNPNIKAKLEEIRNNPDCKNILPDPKDDECNKYYKTTPRDVKKTSKKWDRHKKRHGLAGQWAHKVPKAAGGCATGKNVAPVKPECKKLEDEMATIQDKRFRDLGWR